MSKGIINDHQELIFDIAEITCNL